MVLPSLRESFGIVVLEIMASGRPLIVTRTRGPAQILNDECAYIVSPGDVQDMFEAMCAVASHQEEALKKARAGQLLFNSKYSEDKVVPAIINAYEHIVTKTLFNKDLNCSDK